MISPKLNTSAFGRLSKKDDEEIERAISSVNLTKKANSFVDTLSGGEQKKAFFAMTLAQDHTLGCVGRANRPLGYRQQI